MNSDNIQDGGLVEVCNLRVLFLVANFDFSLQNFEQLRIIHVRRESKY